VATNIAKVVVYYKFILTLLVATFWPQSFISFYFNNIFAKKSREHLI
jgi:hypothetical protein